MIDAPIQAQDSAALRRQLRRARRSLDAEERRILAAQAVYHVLRLRWFTSAHHIASYFPMGAEIDPSSLLSSALAPAREFYLPVLQGPSNTLMFAPLRATRGWQPNCYGIPEPRTPQKLWRAPMQLDLVITPLVGFDGQCNRLGAGGGFYDRSFAFRRHRRIWKRPRLLGLAFDLQRLDSLTPQPWDVPLDAVATENGIFYPETPD